MKHDVHNTEIFIDNCIHLCDVDCNGECDSDYYDECMDCIGIHCIVYRHAVRNHRTMEMAIMSSKAGLRSKAREQSKGIVSSLKLELRLIHLNPEGFVTMQFLKMVKIVQSKHFMDEEKFKTMLKAYIENGTLPEEPKVE